ncbi:hypothetical protein [Caballeronia sp. LZ032]|uniref:hypothetical protein n=1 Tax=Caballeronia sp. LZ032 TaxID=3038565 RepID=UPI00285A436A|nr:hypothetical protein [Caballeronia sp. LZ032]MDR5884225.1 hypothetical protein [Caballeronia sp. LZ032]
MVATATILRHEKVDEAEEQELQRFFFLLRDDYAGETQGMISLRTARVLARELHASTAFMQMVVAITDADEAYYDALVGALSLITDLLEPHQQWWRTATATSR